MVDWPYLYRAYAVGRGWRLRLSCCFYRNCHAGRRSRWFYGVTSHVAIAAVTERLLEDNESVVECMMNWATVSSNMIYFIERVDKYDVFSKPEVRIFKFTFGRWLL